MMVEGIALLEKKIIYIVVTAFSMSVLITKETSLHKSLSHDHLTSSAI